MLQTNMEDIIEFAPYSRLTENAAESVIGFWDTEFLTFWRDSEHQRNELADPNPGKPKWFPTVSFRSIIGLGRYADEQRHSVIADRVNSLLQQSIIPRVLGIKLEEIKSSIDADPNRVNELTLSLYALALCAMKSRCDLSKQQELLEHLREAVSELVKPYLEDAVGVGSLHPYLRYYIGRALRESARFIEEKPEIDGIIAQIDRSTENTINELLARHAIGCSTPADAVALAFSCASLPIASASDISRALAGLAVCISEQDQFGRWPLGRVVHRDDLGRHGEILMSTHEIASVIAETVLLCSKSLENRSEWQLPTQQACEGLLRAADYAINTRVETEDRAHNGWCCEFHFGKQIVESWTSANVIDFGLNLQQLIVRMNNLRILSGFTTIDPKGSDWPTYLRWQDYKTNSEPDSKVRVMDYIDRNIVQLVLGNEHKMPSSKQRTVSLMLFGPPGTSKTSTVKAVAEALGWPVVMLSPGSFIEQGLEYIEAESRKVFDKLQKLVQAVVIFDECDELFRERTPETEQAANRGIAAFVTASMLPKLQDLHDRGRVLFCICTNHISAMDPAVRRGGRIDHMVGIGWPDEAARELIVRTELISLSHRTDFQAVVDGIVRSTERFVRSEMVRLCETVRTQLESTGSETNSETVVSKSIKSYAGTIVIDENAAEAFSDQKAKYCHAYAAWRSSQST